jgi:dephospho-CoA kinase
LLNIGLTGNIAAGKSTVSGWFRRWGATILDADELARDAEAPGSVVLAAIVKRFGKDVLAPDGSLDRPALRGKVMGDDAALAGLNAIVHPAVRARRDELQQEARRRGDLMVVNDIPLLFEALDPAQFDVVVLVDAPVAVRRTRLRALRGLGNDDADRMLAAQMPAERKRERSAYVIENDGDLSRLKERGRAACSSWRARTPRTKRPTSTPSRRVMRTQRPSCCGCPGRGPGFAKRCNPKRPTRSSPRTLRPRARTTPGSPPAAPASC